MAKHHPGRGKTTPAGINPIPPEQVAGWYRRGAAHAPEAPAQPFHGHLTGADAHHFIQDFLIPWFKAHIWTQLSPTSDTEIILFSRQSGASWTQGHVVQITGGATVLRLNHWPVRATHNHWDFGLDTHQTAAFTQVEITDAAEIQVFWDYIHRLMFRMKSAEGVRVHIPQISPKLAV